MQTTTTSGRKKYDSVTRFRVFERVKQLIDSGLTKSPVITARMQDEGYTNPYGGPIEQSYVTNVIWQLRTKRGQTAQITTTRTEKPTVRTPVTQAGPVGRSLRAPIVREFKENEEPLADIGVTYERMLQLFDVLIKEYDHSDSQDFLENTREYLLKWKFLSAGQQQKLYTMLKRIGEI
jgi:hypothetical protein